ncbi:MAG: glutamine amidotransferase, partial [Pseudomonadota bacterium]
EPSDDRVVTWLTQAGYFVDQRKPFAGEPLGDVTDDLAATVIYGGPYNVYETDTHPFLNEEYRWIDACLKADVPMLGLCQGAQQIAHHLGAWAGATPQATYEFGYYQIDPTPTAKSDGFLTEPLHVTQAHFHTFDLPDGAHHLASSETYENQAFRIGQNVYGFQFHPEVTIEGFRRWQVTKLDIAGQNGVQTIESQNRLMHAHDAEQAAWFYAFLNRFIGLPE